jgi:hypothetical protein
VVLRATVVKAGAEQAHNLLFMLQQEQPILGVVEVVVDTLVAVVIKDLEEQADLV